MKCTHMVTTSGICPQCNPPRSSDITTEQATPCNSELLPCPKCECDDLETSPFETTRHGDWEIRCGHPNCHFYLQSNDKQTLCTAWNLIPR